MRIDFGDIEAAFSFHVPGFHARFGEGPAVSVDGRARVSVSLAVIGDAFAVSAATIAQSAGSGFPLRGPSRKLRGQ